MAYTDFTLEAAEESLGLVVSFGVIFPDLRPVESPGWLRDTLGRGGQMAWVSEKARSEFIVAPILLAVRELSGDRIAIFSGPRLDVDPARRLNGECDFLLSLSEPVPLVRAPFVAVVEAKKNDIEAGLGQCAAQMLAGQIFNERAGRPLSAIYGCVTTGEGWQLLRLVGNAVTIDKDRLYIDNLGAILAALVATIPPP